MKPLLKVVELFSGIGAVRKALINAEIDFETIAISEIDKFAIQSYELLYGKTLNLGDISKIPDEKIPDCDLLVYGFPCQDISIAGEQKGLEEGSGTRSSLLWQCFRFIKKARPRYLLMENVKNLVGKTHRPQFEDYLKKLEELGYHSEWKILNSNCFGIPQNRERVLCFSTLEDRKIVFPSGETTNLTLRDICEKTVDEKYFMDKPFTLREPSKNPESGLIHVANLEMKATESIKRVYSKDGCCPTLTTMGGGHREPKILEDNGRVRKLTPRECWLLMGFTNEDFDKVSNLSNTQLYKQAGNSICVPVLEAIIKANLV